MLRSLIPRRAGRPTWRQLLHAQQRRRLLTSPALAVLGARLDATPAQVALAWVLDLASNVLLIPGTRIWAHLAENLASADVKLDDAARKGLARLFPAPVR